MADDPTPPQDSQAPQHELPRIRTYAADMSRVIKARGETLASIVNKERTTVTDTVPEEREPRSYRRLLIGGAILVFIIAGIGTVVGALVFSPKDAATVQQQGIIFANKTVAVTLSEDEALLDQLARVRAESNFPLGEVLRTQLIRDGRVLSAAEVAQALGLPDALAREVTDTMVGVHSFDRNQPFIILKLATYDRSFAALLAWERTMGRSLGNFFAPLGQRADSAPTLTFSDIIVQNLDVRASQSAWPILYTFPEQQLVVITTNEFTFREIITRLSAAGRAP